MDGWRVGRNGGGGGGTNQARGLEASGIIRLPAYCVKTGAHSHRAQRNWTLCHSHVPIFTLLNIEEMLPD